MDPIGYLDRIRECNAHAADRFVPVVIDGRELGFVRRDRIATLLEHVPGAQSDGQGIKVLTGASDLESRSRVFEPLVQALAARGEISALRHERYAVPPPILGVPHFSLERAAVPWLGCGATGVHLNGFVRRGPNLLMWVAIRSKQKPTFPGELDNIVAGGQPAGLGLADNLIKECAEEASLPRALAALARPVGLISYCVEHPSGLKPDVMHCYDLELPEDFQPINADGEVERFELMPIEEVAERVASTRAFKFNCALVVIDFLVRHGVIPPEHPDYLQIVRELRSPPWPRGSTPWRTAQ